MNSIRSAVCNRCCIGMNQFRRTHANFVNDQIQSQVEAKPFEEIPGPKPIPIFGNVWRYMPVIGEYTFTNLFTTYSKLHRQFGPLVREQILGSESIVHVFDPRDMHEIYAKGAECPARRSHGLLARYRKSKPDVYKNAGLFPSNGEDWRKFRELFGGILFSSATTDVYIGVIEDITEDLMKRIHSILDSNSEVDVLPELFRWSLECIGAITLNRRLGCLSAEEHEDANILIESAHDTHNAVYMTEIFQFLKSSDNPIYRKLAKAQGNFERIVGKYLEEVLNDKEKLEKNYILSRMTDPKIGADFKEIFTMILDMFLAGIDTTAYTTGFALYNLAKNPSVQEKLRQELTDRLTHKSTRLTEGRNMYQLRYLTAVYHETLRMNPVAVGNGRILPKDFILSGYKVPAKTNVILQHQVAARQNQHFKQANVFMPERWKNMTVLQNLMASPYGFDKRSCIGKFFARNEMVFAIARLVRNFRIEYHYEDVGIKTELINVPDKPIKLRFIPIEH